MNVIRKTTQQCIVVKESITYDSACTLRARRGPNIDAHFIHLLVIRLLPSLVSLVSPRTTCAMFIECSLPNDSRNHLDVYWSGSAFYNPKVTELDCRQ